MFLGLILTKKSVLASKITLEPLKSSFYMKIENFDFLLISPLKKTKGTRWSLNGRREKLIHFNGLLNMRIRVYSPKRATFSLLESIFVISYNVELGGFKNKIKSWVMSHTRIFWFFFYFDN